MGKVPERPSEELKYGMESNEGKVNPVDGAFPVRL
jgi:hypothetical protein